MLLIIDNYDSFVFNVARYCEELGREALVVRNNRIALEDIQALKPTSIIISPGPCTPAEAGISLPAIRTFSGTVPILGVCLGHQCIGAVFGGEVVKAEVPMHGRSSLVEHSQLGLFNALPTPLRVGRYHSLIVKPERAMDRALKVDATSLEGEVMALSHRTDPTFGVQFHPESILTDFGHALLANFFAIADRWHNGDLAER